MVDSERSDFLVGLLASTIGHVILAAAFLLNLNFGGSKLSKSVVYSVTMEGGKVLGGISQVPKDQDSKIAPPKKVQSAQEKAPKKEDRVKSESKKPEVKLTEKKEEVKPKPEPLKKEQKAKAETESAAQINKQLQMAMQRYRGESSDAGGKGFGAGALGGKRMGGGVVLPPEALAYMETLKNSVKEGWRWYDTSAVLTTWVVFDIARDGVISNVSVVTGSGNREFDESVLRAVWKASPVPAPPDKVYDTFKSVRMSFDPRE